MHKLTPDQQQALLDLREHEGAKALMLEVANAVEQMNAAVSRVPLGLGEIDHAEREIVYKRLEAQGAEKLAKAIQLALFPSKKPAKDDKK